MEREYKGKMKDIYNMPRAQDSEAMYYNLAKKHRSRIMQKPGARAAFVRPKNFWFRVSHKP